MPTMLVADDEQDNRVIVGRMLERAGYRVITVANGSQALAIAPTVQPDVILLDMNMPIMGGVAAAAAFRADPQFQHVPLVAFTARALRGEREHFLAAGFDAYLAKPFDFADVCSVVADLLTRPR